MWVTLLSLAFGALPTVIEALGKAKHDSLNAETEQQRIAADERVKALEAQRDVLIKESSTPWNNIARFALLAPFAFYLAWVVAYDKIICKWFTQDLSTCSTDPLSPWLNGIAAAMVGFYFLTDMSKIWKR